MNKIIQNNSQQTISTFDLIETFHIESQSLHQQIKAISQTINSLIQIAKTQEDENVSQAFANLGLSNNELSNLSEVDKKFSRINDMMESITQAYLQDQMALTSKDLELNKKEITLKAQHEQERTRWLLEKQSLEERVSVLTKDLEETKAVLVENIATASNEEKANKKKMEMWFKRRLDAVEHYIIDLKGTPQDEAKFERLLNKVRRLKTKQPWNDSKKPHLILDDAALNQKSEVFSNGTSTPFSHYVCVLSSAASENNPLDKGFLCSINNSLPATQKSHNSFLSGPLSKSINNNKQHHLESVMKKLQDSKLSISEKEKLFCEAYKNSPSGNDAFIHVKLEDILNAANVSKSHDSLSLDLKSNGGQPKYTFKFNQKMRFDDLKDTKLEKAISTIQSQGSQKSSDLFGTSLKRSKSLEHEKVLLFGSQEPNLEQLMNLDITNKEKEEVQSALDKGIMQEISIEPSQIVGQESKNMLESLQNMLATEKMMINTSGNILKSIMKNEKRQEIDLSAIENKKYDTNIVKFDGKLIGNSFLGDEDDGIKDFLEEETLDMKVLGMTKFKENEAQISQKSFMKEIEALQENSINKSFDIQFLKNIETQNKNPNIPSEIDTENTSGQILVQEIDNEKESEEEIQSLVKVRKSNEIPVLDFNRIREKFQKQPTKPAPPVIIIDNSSSLERNNQKGTDLDSAGSQNTGQSSEKEHIIISPSPLSIVESPHIQHNGFMKIPFKSTYESIEGAIQNNPRVFGLYNPRKSMDTPHLVQPRAPALMKKKMHPRPNLSLVEDIKATTPVAYDKTGSKPHRPSHSPSMFNMGSDLFLDVEYQFQYQEQEGGQENFQPQVKKNTEFSQNHKIDSKNTRNSWSFTIDQEQKFVNPPNLQMHAKGNSLMGRNNHIRQKTTDACPPGKGHNQAYFVRSSYANSPVPQQGNPSFQINCSVGNTPLNNVSYPNSYESTQEGKGSQGIENSGINMLRKIIPSENLKFSQVPVILEHREELREISNETLNQAKETINIQKGNKTPKEIYSHHTKKEMRPISPLNQNRDVDFKLALPLQKKSKFLEEKIISVSNTPVNGSAQFRARMFAPKKA